MPKSVVVTVDASDIQRIARNMGLAATNTLSPTQMLWRQHRVAAQIMRELQYAAPSQSRTDDKRYRNKLRDSFSKKGVGGSVVIYTNTPGKYTWTNFGARPPSGGSGYIFPNPPKKALYWPGLGHPISQVGPPVTRRHPGQRGTNWAAPILSHNLNHGTDEDYVRELTRLNGQMRHLGLVDLLAAGAGVASTVGAMGGMVIGGMEEVITGV
jgi:hypothetical protein